MKEIVITDIGGIKVGHEQDLKAATGCTVILCEKGATAGVDVRGGAPGTRETDLLNSMNLVEKVHAVFMAGGSAFGLDAAAGIMQYLEERKSGFDVGVTRVPIVTGAVLFDLHVGDFKIRPDGEMGYSACSNSARKIQLEGNVGAGTGATVGKVLGMDNAMKGGLGTYCVQVGELKVGAVIAVNCFGDVIENGKIVAGTLKEDGLTFADSQKILAQQFGSGAEVFRGNTTLGTVITNAVLTKPQANKVASMAHDGYARAIRPAHTMVDGDTVFVMATGEVEAGNNIVGMLAAHVVEKAVINAVKKAESIYGIISYSELTKG